MCRVVLCLQRILLFLRMVQGVTLTPPAGQIAAAVFTGTAASTTSGTVTGLAANTAYFIHVYEYTTGA